MLFGNSVVVGKSNDLSDLERKVFPELLYEFYCGERIGTVAIGDELKVLRQFCQSPEGHAQGEDAGADATVIGYLITDNGTAGGIHDEPDIGFDAADFDIGFVSNECISFLVGVLVDKGFDADSCGLTVVGDLLVGDADVIQILKSLGSLAQGQSEVDMESKAQGHDMCVVFTEFQGRGVLGEGV